VLIEPHRKADAIENAGEVVPDERQIVDCNLAAERRCRLRLLFQQPGVDHSCGLDLLDGLVVFDSGILKIPIENQQLVPGRRQIFIGEQHR